MPDTHARIAAYRAANAAFISDHANRDEDEAREAREKEREEKEEREWRREQKRREEEGKEEDEKKWRGKVLRDLVRLLFCPLSSLWQEDADDRSSVFSIPSHPGVLLGRRFLHHVLFRSTYRPHNLPSSLTSFPARLPPSKTDASPGQPAPAAVRRPVRRLFVEV